MVIESREYAYAPYSDFKVGAVVLTEEGKTFTGCNVENASFGATVCAERVAVFKAISEGYRQIRAIAVAAESSEPVPLCGECLQVLSEFGPDAEVIMANTTGGIRQATLKQLMPLAFTFNVAGQ